MAKTILFSQAFPSYHSKAGKPTLFVEKIWRYIDLHPETMDTEPDNAFVDRVILKSEENIDLHDLAPKLHTIRKGNRWQEGDVFSPRVWSGPPYRSKQIPIAPEMRVKKLWPILILPAGEVFINGQQFGFYGSPEINRLAINDGLTAEDFVQWFRNLPFEGQIICWDADLEY